VVVVTAFAALAVAALAYADQAPIPLKPPTGYRDYCAGMKRGKDYPCPRGGAQQSVWRALHLPSVTPGDACPVGTPHVVTARIAPVLGSPPVYFAAGAYNASDRTTMLVHYPAPPASVAAGTGWTLAKTAIVVKKSFRQPLVVRGRRIDGPGEIGFTGPKGRRPFSAMQFPPTGLALELGSYEAHGLLVWGRHARLLRRPTRRCDFLARHHLPRPIHVSEAALG